ncbi:hypothetical protein ABG067_004307 [Albugo candida]
MAKKFNACNEPHQSQFHEQEVEARDYHLQISNSFASDVDNDAESNRFVAGAKFFNYQRYGALRSGGEVSLFSRDYGGLLAAAFASSATFSIVKTCVRPVLMTHLHTNQRISDSALEYLLSLPTSFSFFYGLISDTLPIYEYRRKSYMILGAFLSMFALIGLTILSFVVTMHSSRKHEVSPVLYFYIGLIILAVTGTLISKVATDAQIIELSQREPLTKRGLTQINYLLFREIVEACGIGISSIMIRYDEVKMTYEGVISPAWIYAILFFVSMITIQLTFLHNVESPVIQRIKGISVDANDTTEYNEQVHILSNRWAPVYAFYRMCQQRAVWQLVTFLMIAMATSRFHFGRGFDVLKQLAHLRQLSELIGNAFRMLVTLTAMFAWRAWLINVSWRYTVSMAILLCIGLEILQFMLILYVDSVRNEYFYYTIHSFLGVEDAILIIFAFIPATEIAEYGLEGATSGLLASFRSIMKTSVGSICEKISHIEYFAALSTKTIAQLCILFWISAIIQGAVCFAIPLLPRQKLDAQQLRVYGGYSHIAFIFLSVCFCFTFVIATYLNIHSVYGIVHNWY